MYVFVKDHDCTDGIEKLYYSCGFEAICVYCASEDLEDTETHLFYHNARNAPNHIKNALGNQKPSHKLFCFHCFRKDRLAPPTRDIILYRCSVK